MFGIFYYRGKDTLMKNLMYFCLGLALVAALGYFLMGISVIHPGNLNGEGAPLGFDWIATGGYVVGGALILLKKRNLWITGAVINAIVIVGFYAMYHNQSDVMLSAPGLITKIPQILLEIGLISLILQSRRVRNIKNFK